ncbi:hypothetical protein F3Y22_tig00110387pilonHSYRG00537 [Hibiscus syriacus]|uniref:CRA domain-containing protein n=1 Tax=Hibiscus syriacus TaxID=106335 RepID=A0A6A3AQN3_HIBSY|nr:hypothetical protein F3Y22_tig00110387pilonHSYRG00537 [Hibiscus syriacus]
MELNSLKDAFDRVAKKQKLFCSKAHEVMDQIVQEIENAIEMMQPTTLDHKSILTELKKKLHEIAPLSQLEGTQKELNVALSKYPKALEKALNPDISKAYRNIEFDSHTVNQIIASHFYRQGLFDVGDCFITEAGEAEAAAAIRSLFKKYLLLGLHQLQFVQILQNGSRDEALKYARTNFVPFAGKHMAEIQKLMGLAEELTRQFCKLLGQSYESPLSVTIAAGVQGLPPLLKFMTVMAGKKQEWLSMKQLPVPVELDKEFQFHSIFVSRV